MKQLKHLTLVSLIPIMLVTGISQVQAKRPPSLDYPEQQAEMYPAPMIRPFKIKIKTDNEGVTDNYSFKIPTRPSEYYYNYKVDCDSDGVYEATGVPGNYTCEYDSIGEHTVSISGTFPQIYFYGRHQDNLKVTSIEQWGSIQWSSMERAFYKCENMLGNAKDVPNLSNVTSTNRMFYRAKLFNGDVSSWDVSNITDMSHMFYSANYFNQDVSSWNVSNVTDMSFTFSGAFEFNSNIGFWDVSNVNNMSSMLANTSFNHDIGNWDVSNVTDMSGMFYAAKKFNQDIGDWDVSNVTNMSHMFWFATHFNQFIGYWNVSNVTNMMGMFYAAKAFNTSIYCWDVSNVIDMSKMFLCTNSFNQSLERWNVSNVKNMSRMFLGARNFNKRVGEWNVSRVTDMSRMFRKASSFSNNDLSKWDVSSVTNHSDFSDGWGSGNTEPAW